MPAQEMRQAPRSAKFLPMPRRPTSPESSVLALSTGSSLRDNAGTAVALWSPGMQFRARGRGRGASRFAKASAAVMTLFLVFQTAALCMCPPAAKACEAGGCCPRASAQHHQGPASSRHGFTSAHPCCPAAQAPSATQAQLQDRSVHRDAAPAFAATQPWSDTPARPEASDIVTPLARFNSSSPPTLILRI